MKTKKLIGKLVLLAAAFLLLVNPGWIPFLDAGVKNAMAADVKASFGILAGGTSGPLAPGRVLSALAAGILIYLAVTLGNLLLAKATAGKKRGASIAGLLSSILTTVGVIAGLVWILSILGVNLGAIFASLGIASLVIGFGVQSLIEDCVTGIFIILEGQYDVGDIIVLEDFRGTVRKITMRTTVIEDDGGNLKIINNSDIRNVQNRSNANSMAICNFSISYDADLRQAEQILKDALPGMYERNADVFEAMPVYAGVQALGASSVDLRIWVHAKESNIFAATRRLNREVKLLADESGIEIPFNQIVVHQA